MTPINSINDQNTMRRVIYGFMYTLMTKTRIKEKT